MATVIRIVLMLLGLIIALFGIGSDFLLPGTSPGLNLPQVLIILAGLGISVFAYNLFRPQFRRRLNSGRGLILTSLLTIVTLLILELILTVVGASTYALKEMPHGIRRTLSASMCDEGGCRANYDYVAEACARREKEGRFCIVNRQGFADDEDFVAREDFAERHRILMLGDSFTQGYSADVGSSFVEIIEARFSDFVVWNAGFTTTGTNQAVASFEMLGPILQPELTVLGFYMNDFIDNLTPVDSWYATGDRHGKQEFIRPYRIDEWGNAIRLDDKTTKFFLAHGTYPPKNEFERILGSLRLGTLALRLRDSIAMVRYEERLFAKGVEATRDYLSKLRDLAASQSSELLVILIPDRADLTAVGERYKISIKLMEELQMPYMDLIVKLDAGQDYMPPPNIHWNSAGHQKVGALLSDCVQVFIASGKLGDCEHVVLP